METVVSNLSAAKARRVTENGRDWFVAPMTLYREAVLHGSKGPLFYPLSEIKKALSAWDGVPITLGHPTDATNNTHLSARSPGVLDATGLGIVRHPRLDGDRLRAEGWFDIAKLKKVSPQVLASIEANRAVEVSTGLYTSNVPTASSHNGRPYDAVAADHVPDHLAVLVDAKGACAISDGCGLMVNQYLEPGDECPECGYTLTPGEIDEGFCENCGADLESLVGNATPAKEKRSLWRRLGEALGILSASREVRNAAPGLTHADYLLRAALVQHMQKTDTPGALEDARGGTAVYAHEGKTYRRRYTGEGDELTWDGEPEEVLKVGGHYRRPKGAGSEVGAPEDVPAEVATENAIAPTDRQAALGRDAATQKAETGHNPPNWAVDEALWEKAKEAADKTYDEGDDAYWPAVVAIYEKMGGEIQGKTTNANPEGCNQYKSCEGGGAGENAPPMPSGHKEWGQLAKKYSEAEFAKMADALIAHVGEASFKEHVEWQASNYQALRGSGLQNRPEALRARAALDTYVTDQSNAAGQAREAEGPARGASAGHRVSEADVEKAWRDGWAIARGSGKTKGQTANREEDTDMDRNATIGWLVANCDCWKTKGPVLANKDSFSDEELARLKAEGEKAKQDAVVANAARKTGILVANASADDTEAMMKKCKELMDAEKKEPAMNAARLTPEEQEDLAFARAEKNRQKAVLVERLTANVGDPGRRAQLSASLMQKPLGELHERLELLPPPVEQQGIPAQPAPNYGGAAFGVYNQAPPAKDDSDNLLPMPTVNYGEMASPALRKKA